MSFIIIISLVSGAAGAVLTERLALRMGLLDTPEYRSSHSVPTPKGGGVGILAALAVISLVARVPSYFWAPAAVVSLVSYAGDRWELAPVFRLFVQLAAAMCVVLGYRHGGGVLFTFCSGNIACTVVLMAATAVFIAGTANFYNFMDGINGIAALTAINAFILLGLWSHAYNGPAWVLPLCLGIAASCAGFLPFNFPTARVFMGDVGSVLLGFMFGALVLILAEDITEAMVLSIFIFPFYADELVTMYQRIRRGERLAEPHRRHLYQVIANEGGIAHWKVTACYVLFQLTVGLSCWWAWSFLSGSVAWLLAIIWFTLFVVIDSRVKAAFLQEADE